MASVDSPSRRTDEIRARRASRPRKAVTSRPATQPAGKRTSRSTKTARTEKSHFPPVMARSSTTGMALPQTKRGKKARRRYDVALSSFGYGLPGAEVRLPSMPQLGVSWRLVSLLMVAAIGFMLYHLWDSPNYRVDAPEIVGLQRLSSRDVNAVLDIAGEQIFALDASSLEQKLHEAFPELIAASVQVKLPASVLVTVEERLPVMVWRQGGRTDLVDASGVSFPLRNEAQELPGIVVEATGSPPAPELAQVQLVDLDVAARQPASVEQILSGSRQLLSQEMVVAILVMAEQAPQNTPLVYDALHGLGWKDARGWDVYFGDARNMDMKLVVYRAIVKQLKADEIQPVLISVEFVHAPYYRLE